jgi:hypothetical protein
VEGVVGYGRRNYLVPVPDLALLDELNRFLDARTRADEPRRRRGDEQTVGEPCDRELALLQPLLERSFLACTRHPVRTTQQALVTFRQRAYSVPLRHAGQRL